MSSTSNEVICRVEEIPQDGALDARFQLGDRVVDLILIRRSGKVFAYHNVCPHAGRALNWAPGQFLFTPKGNLVCAAHGATFVVETGEAIGGPCIGARLTPFPIEIGNGAVCSKVEVLDAAPDSTLDEG